MGTGTVALIIAAGVVVLFAGVIIAIYNKLVAGRNQVENGWRQIDVQLRRRHDLIPNLVEVVKDYMSYEKETLEAVIKARSGAVAAQEGGDRTAQIAAEGAWPAGPPPARAATGAKGDPGRGPLGQWARAKPAPPHLRGCAGHPGRG